MLKRTPVPTPARRSRCRTRAVSAAHRRAVQWRSAVTGVASPRCTTHRPCGCRTAQRRNARRALLTGADGNADASAPSTTPSRHSDLRQRCRSAAAGATNSTPALLRRLPNRRCAICVSLDPPQVAPPPAGTPTSPAAPRPPTTATQPHPSATATSQPQSTWSRRWRQPPGRRSAAGRASRLHLVLPVGIVARFVVLVARQLVVVHLGQRHPTRRTRAAQPLDVRLALHPAARRAARRVRTTANRRDGQGRARPSPSSPWRQHERLHVGDRRGRQRSATSVRLPLRDGASASTSS